jgi:hypothetical protein
MGAEVVQNGLEFLRNQFDTTYGHDHIGTSDTATGDSQTGLQGTTVDSTPVSWSDSAPNSYTRRANTTATHTGDAITGGSGSETVWEAGVFAGSATPGTDMYARGVFSSAAVVEPGDTLEVTWDVDFSNQ